MTGVPAVRLVVAGAGLIGRRHLAEIAACPSTRLAAVVDPAPAADVVAERYGIPRYRSLTEFLDRDRPDGVVLATPDQVHVDGGRSASPGSSSAEAPSAGSSPSPVRPCSPSPPTTPTPAGAGGGGRPRLGTSPPT